MTIIPRLWESDAMWARLSRGLLTPASLVYAGVSSVRNALYDGGIFAQHHAALPVISIGNLSVGGTGKTPIAAWMAAELHARGARPAVVLRGYGGDETKVHAVLNPTVPVIANADRIVGVRDAAAAGADVVVLDDAFQHRRIARREDVVLVNADRWREPIRVLPAGPFRETPAALRRASLVMVTRKAVDEESADVLLRRLTPLTRTNCGAIAILELADVKDAVTGAARPLSDMRGARVLVAAGVADPASLAAQLTESGLDVTMRVFPDHHVYGFSDIEQLARDVKSFDHIICTLKDAVKLAPRWPREGPPLWYVSLRCRIAAGQADVSAMLDRVLAARSSHIPVAPAGRASPTPYT